MGDAAHEYLNERRSECAEPLPDPPPRGREK
jgi:hypothetical protein